MQVNDSLSFKGLWGNSSKYNVLRRYGVETIEKIEYHPFRKESSKKIVSELNKIKLPDADKFESTVKKAKISFVLPFTEKEYMDFLEGKLKNKAKNMIENVIGSYNLRKTLN